MNVSLLEAGRFTVKRAREIETNANRFIDSALPFNEITMPDPLAKSIARGAGEGELLCLRDARRKIAPHCAQVFDGVESIPLPRTSKPARVLPRSAPVFRL
jgi:hypothetical protein